MGFMPWMTTHIANWHGQTIQLFMHPATHTCVVLPPRSAMTARLLLAAWRYYWEGHDESCDHGVNTTTTKDRHKMYATDLANAAAHMSRTLVCGTTQPGGWCPLSP
jgi:hypothetical protein